MDGLLPEQLYNAAGLRDQAASVDWGREIVDDSANHPEPTATWMGSGHFPPQGWQNAGVHAQPHVSLRHRWNNGPDPRLPVGDQSERLPDRD